MNSSLYPLVDWISVVWLPIVFVLLFASIANYTGREVIKASIRRTIHGHHFGPNTTPSIDIKKRQDTIINLGVALWKVIVVSAAALALFKIIFPDIDLLPILASAGLVGAVLGFGAQSVIKDFIGGISIIAENQFRVGDEVLIEGGGSTAEGVVEHITLRSTVLRDKDGDVHYVANGSVLHVINKTSRYVALSPPKTSHPRVATDPKKR